MDENLSQAIERVRAGLKQDGGDLEVVSFEDGVLKVRLKGACAGCPMSQMTLSSFVEREIKKVVPTLKRLEAVL